MDKNSIFIHTEFYQGNSMASYKELFNPPLQAELSCSIVAEKRANYYCLTERHVQAMWLEQKYFKQLSTNEEQPIKIISPGIWNSEAGPDFLKAHLQIGDQEFRGDIEIHLNEDSWYHHKHHLDSNYDDVILHVSFWKNNKPKPILTSQGKNLTSTQLEPYLTISESRITKLIDLDLYPYRHFVGTGHCAEHLFNKLSVDKTLEFFQSAAEWRLEQKWNSLIEQTKPHSPIIAGIALALGYKHNSDRFLELYNDLQSHIADDEESLLSLALGLCGFFESNYIKKWGNSSYYQSLKKRFDSFSIPPKYTLRLDKIRPANHPVRRLAILSKLCLDPNAACLADNIKSLWLEQWASTNKKKWLTLRRNMIGSIPHYSDSYWELHYTFEVKPQSKPISMIGDDLKAEILINICLPQLYNDIQRRNETAELIAFREFYSTIPTRKSRKSQYLTFRFFGDHPDPKFISQANLQQGTFQLHRDFCTHFEASCIGCPFVDRYKKRLK